MQLKVSKNPKAKQENYRSNFDQLAELFDPIAAEKSPRLLKS